MKGSNMTNPQIHTARVDILCPGFGESFIPAATAELHKRHPGAEVVSARAVAVGDVRNPKTGQDDRILEVVLLWKES